MNGSFNTSIGRAFEHLNLYFDSLHPLICDQQARKKPPKESVMFPPETHCLMVRRVELWNQVFKCFIPIDV